MHVPTLDRQKSREIDRRAVEQFGMSSLVLMENAGRALADLLIALEVHPPVVVCCGKGNNGGDGLVLARHLDLRGIAVRVVLWADPAKLAPDAAANYVIASRSGIPMTILGDADYSSPLGGARVAGELRDAAWIVDALLGTSGSGEPRPPLDQAIAAINAQEAVRLAVDLPSGLDCDTGTAAHHTIRARHTGTFVAAKAGFFAPGAEQYTGQVHVLDIGAPRRLIEEILGS